MIKKPYTSPSLFSSLSDMLNPSHPLYKLSDKINWEKFDAAFRPLYCQHNGRPSKPVCWYSSTFVISQMNPLWSNGVKTLIINTFVVCRSLYPLLLVLLPNWFTFAIALGRRVLNSSFRKAFVSITKMMMNITMIPLLSLQPFRKRPSPFLRMPSCIKR